MRLSGYVRSSWCVSLLWKRTKEEYLKCIKENDDVSWICWIINVNSKQQMMVAVLCFASREPRGQRQVQYTIAVRRDSCLSSQHFGLAVYVKRCNTVLYNTDRQTDKQSAKVFLNSRNVHYMCTIQTSEREGDNRRSAKLLLSSSWHFKLTYLIMNIIFWIVTL